MSKTAVITARVDEETLRLLDEIAARRERSRAWLLAKAIKGFLAAETAFDDFIKQGEDAIDRGEYLSQEEMEAWFEARYKATDAA
jgi:predicted transcriptional regulator